MIKSFGDRITEDLWSTGASRRLPPDVLKRALKKLQQLHAATTLGELRLAAGNRLHALSGDLEGYWSIRVNDQWRLIFRFDGVDAIDVSMIDYH